VEHHSSDGRLYLRPSTGADADVLYADLDGTRVTDTLAWNGPESLEELREGLEARGEQTRAGELHMYTIVEEASGMPVGCIDVRREEDGTWTTGLWVAERAQGRGLGTAAVETITRYAIERLHVEALEAHVFVGNESSRRIFEKNGYVFAETRTHTITKRGRAVDEWVLVHRARPAEHR
jgi:RimJ/RimL family protein N-acetyltransferase